MCNSARWKYLRSGPHTDVFDWGDFDNKATAYSKLVQVMAEQAGQTEAVLITHLFSAGMHQGPGTFCQDPITLQEQLARDVRSALPDQFVLIVGFMDLLLWPSVWAQHLGTCDHFDDIAGQHDGGQEVATSGVFSLVEVPHCHVLVWAFEESGEPTPWNKLVLCPTGVVHR